MSQLLFGVIVSKWKIVMLNKQCYWGEIFFSEFNDSLFYSTALFSVV